MHGQPRRSSSRALLGGWYDITNILPSFIGGAIHSSQILMLSGIGPTAQLLRHNVQVVLDAPGVGANLIDHPTCAVRLKETTRMTLNPDSLRLAHGALVHARPAAVSYVNSGALDQSRRTLVKLFVLI